MSEIKISENSFLLYLVTACIDGAVDISYRKETILFGTLFRKETMVVV